MIDMAKSKPRTFTEYKETRLTPDERRRLELTASITGSIIMARKEKNMTQKELAKTVNMSQSAIARIECSRITPRVDTVMDVLFPLGYTLEVVPLKDSQPKISEAEAEPLAPAVV